ncbi:MAG TPA: TIGR02206 family membrane protein [bacterium]|nr:TIGR02206 family membrane protein [bacterium]
MPNIFSYNFQGGSFVAFSRQHIWGILGVAILISTVVIFDRLTNQKYQKFISLSMAIILLLRELSLSIVRIYWGVWEISTSLPLQLCGMAVILSAVLLITKNYQIYEIVYFWSLAGAVQALLQPNLTRFGFPHYRYFQFFLSHGLIMTTAIFATVSFGFRPTKKSIIRVFVFTNIYALFIGLFNLISGGNYMFLCHKPETASLMDAFGPWPIYIIPLEIIALVSYLFYYSPFAIYDYITKNSMTSEISYD